MRKDNIFNEKANNFFKNRPVQTFKSALPRTVAPITAAKGASIGATVGAFMFAFALDNPPDSMIKMLPIFAVTIVPGFVIGGSVGYVGGYGGTNLLMQAFPALKNKQSTLLLKPGLRGQIGLFSAVLLTPIAYSLASDGIKALTHSSASSR